MRSFLYRLARLLGDINAVKKGSSGSDRYAVLHERAVSSPSLVVVLNRFDIANARFGIEACGSFRSTLSEKIPALVQILFNLTHPLALGVGGGTLSFLPEELVLLMYQLAYPLSKVLILHTLP